MSGPENGGERGGGNQFDPNLLTKEITTDNAAARVEELITAREAIEKQLADVAEANRKLAADQDLVQEEQTRIQAEQARIQVEHERVQAEAVAVRNRQQELTSIQHRRTRSRLHDGVHINRTNLFQIPTGPAA